MTKTTCIQFFKPAANFNSKQRAAPASVVKNGSASIVTCHFFGVLNIKCNNRGIQYTLSRGSEVRPRPRSQRQEFGSTTLQLSGPV